MSGFQDGGEETIEGFRFPTLFIKLSTLLISRISKVLSQRLVAVGTPVTGRPMHGSVRAHFSAYGSYLGAWRQTARRVQDAGIEAGQETINNLSKPLPRKPMPLTAAPRLFKKPNRYTRSDNAWLAASNIT